MLSCSNFLAEKLLFTLRDAFSTGTVVLYDGVRPLPGELSGAIVAVIPFATPAGSVDDGKLQITLTSASSILGSNPPTWARLFDSQSNWLADCDARLTSVDDAGQEFVIDALELYTGAEIRLSSGTFSIG